MMVIHSAISCCFFVFGVLICSVFSASAPSRNYLGERCRLASDCGDVGARNDGQIVCRWSAEACGFGVCSCADNLVEDSTRHLCVAKSNQSAPVLTTTSLPSTPSGLSYSGARPPKQVTHANYGEPCSLQRYCSPGLSCFAGNCDCPSSSRYVDGKCQFYQVGDQCERDEDCFRATNSFCAPDEKRCGCRDGFKKVSAAFRDFDGSRRNETRCVGNDESLLQNEGDFCGDAFPSGVPLKGALCAEGLECTSCGGAFGVCSKISSVASSSSSSSSSSQVVVAESPDAQVGKICSSVNDCLQQSGGDASGGPRTMVCSLAHEACAALGRCVCAKGYIADPWDGFCKKAIEIGQPCRNRRTDICADRHAECINGQCQCGSEWKLGPGNKCVSERDHLFYGYACAPNGTWECHDNMICESGRRQASQSRCECRRGQRIDKEAFFLVEYIQFDDSPARRIELYHCTENKIGDACLNDDECSLAPNTRCDKGVCACATGYVTVPYLPNSNDAASVIEFSCVSQKAPRARANATCGTEVDGVTKICGDDGLICTRCGGDQDKLICVDADIGNITTTVAERTAGTKRVRSLQTGFDAPSTQQSTIIDSAQQSLSLHKMGDICMVNDDCNTQNGDLVCGLADPLCGHYGRCMCAPGFEESLGICKPTIGQRCTGECASPRSKCLFGICQCDSAIQFNPQWYSLGAKLYTGPMGSSIDCSIWESQFSGDACSVSNQCFRGMRCSSNMTCACPAGYKVKPEVNSYQCIPAEFGDSCSSDDDCSRIESASCNETSSTCQCRAGSKPVRLLYYDASSSSTAPVTRCVDESEQPRTEKERCMSLMTAAGSGGSSRNKDQTSDNNNKQPLGYCREELVCSSCLFSDNICLPPQRNDQQQQQQQEN